MKTIAQQLNIKEFPFKIKDDKNNIIYIETECGYWGKWRYNSDGSEGYFENSDGIIIPDRVKSDPIVDSVVEQFKERSKVGIQKYGTTLERDDLSPAEWIKEAQQEAMDFCLYLEKLKTLNIK